MPLFTSPPVDAMAKGKRQLLDAAVRLAADGRAVSSMGLRELAREADLNPNTFYRHFDDIDDLGRTLARAVHRHLMADLHDARQQAADAGDDASRVVVERYFDAVIADPTPYRIGLNELHGPSASMRSIVADLLVSLAEESVTQIRESIPPSMLPDGPLHDIATHLTMTMFQTAGELMAQPDRRDELTDRLVRIIGWMFAGALADAPTASA